MRKLLFLSLLLAAPVFVAAQTQNIGTCFNTSNKRSVDNKMEKLLLRVSKETNVPKENLTYTVTDYFTGFYSKACRHLPKRITIDAQGEKRTYKHGGLSGAIVDWLLGSWSEVK